MVQAEHLDCPIRFMRDIVQELGSEDAAKLVAHRGFHSVSDDLSRPLENSLPAYEYAWTAGINHCECDIALTADGELVLCHDDNLQRLALKGEINSSAKEVRKMTFQELNRTPLKNGSRVPLLFEVLEASRRLSEEANLVIEVKPDNRTELVASAVCLFFKKHPHLVGKVSVIMSFDFQLIHCLNRLLQPLFKQYEIRPKILLLLLSTYTNEKESAKVSDLRMESNRLISIDLAKDTHENEAMISRSLMRSGVSLDGVYIQFNGAMLTNSRANELVRNLCSKITCGIWGKACDPDNITTFRELCSLGAKFVNSDLPEGFSSKI